MKKTVVMIGNSSWGMYQFRADLMKEFIKRGHKVVVLAPHDQWTYLLHEIGVITFDTKVERKGANPLDDLSYIFSLLRLILNLRPDIVLSYTIKPVLYGTFAAWIAGVPQRIAITTGLGYVFSHQNLITKISKLLYKFVLRFSSEVWFLNADDRDIFIKSKLVEENKTFILPGEGVNIHHYSPVERSQTIPTFTLIARMLWDKGVGIFVEAAKEIKQKNPSLLFNLVGPTDYDNPEGICSEQLKEWHESGIVQYIGHTNDVREILKETDCLVHPTYYREGLPRVLMEANSMGIPCITTDIPGCRDVIIDGINGFLVQPKNIEQLKEKILSYCQLHESIRKDISILARDRVMRNFSSEIINDIYISRLSL